MVRGVGMVYLHLIEDDHSREIIGRTGYTGVKVELMKVRDQIRVFLKGNKHL